MLRTGNDYSFLPNSLKKSTSEPLVIVDNKELPEDAEGLYVDGVIFLRDNWDISTLIHEWRHHWQAENAPFLFTSDSNSHQLLHNLAWDYENYWSSIVTYFLSSRAELDALIFECKFAPCDTNLWQLEHVIHELEKMQKTSQTCKDLLYAATNLVSLERAN